MKTLIVFSHSFFENSRVNKALIAAAKTVPDVTVHNLEEMYGQNPEKIDIRAEQKALEENDRIVFQSPVFWFNVPAMLKGYLDRVFEHGWAYGSSGHALEGKIFQLVLSAGGQEAAYKTPSMGELMLPLTASADFVGMKTQPILVAYGCLNISDDDIRKMCDNYKKMLAK